MYIFYVKKNAEENLFISSKSKWNNPYFGKTGKTWSTVGVLKNWLNRLFANTAVYPYIGNIEDFKKQRIVGFKIDLDAPDINLPVEEFLFLKFPKEIK